MSNIEAMAHKPQSQAGNTAVEPDASFSGSGNRGSNVALNRGSIVNHEWYSGSGLIESYLES